MQTIINFLTFAALAANAYMLYSIFYIPQQKKNAAWEKLTKKEREEYERKIDIEKYLGVKVEKDNKKTD